MFGKLSHCFILVCGGINEVYIDGCVPDCQPRCHNTRICNNCQPGGGCVCKAGYIRDWRNWNACVKPEDCQPFRMFSLISMFRKFCLAFAILTIYCINCYIDYYWLYFLSDSTRAKYHMLHDHRSNFKKKLYLRDFRSSTIESIGCETQPIQNSRRCQFFFQF